jgi:hypothetical protein
MIQKFKNPPHQGFDLRVSMFSGNLDNLLGSKHCFRALKFVIVLLVYEHRYCVCAFSPILDISL